VLKGKVARILRDKGFGFIKAEDGKEYFFHRSGIVGGGRFDTLKEFDSVEFDDQSGPKGLRAERVVIE
jgi:CspA family cold shock protein